jgi:sec-independent protein translocase protein TatA
MNLGFTEILLILVLALVLFGAKRLPEIGQAMGKALREFKKAVDGAGDDILKENEKKDSGGEK